MTNFNGHIKWLNLLNDLIQWLYFMAKPFQWLILIIKLNGKKMINSNGNI